MLQPHLFVDSLSRFKNEEDIFLFLRSLRSSGREARRQSGKLMVAKIEEIAKNQPVILVGDFNSTPETEQIKTIQTLLNDTRAVTTMPPYGPEGTFNAFKFDAPRTSVLTYFRKQTVCRAQVRRSD